MLAIYAGINTLYLQHTHFIFAADIHRGVRCFFINMDCAR